MTRHDGENQRGDPLWRAVAEFTLADTTESIRDAAQRVAEAVRALGLPTEQEEAVRAAVAEAALKAAVHGGGNPATHRVKVRVWATVPQAMGAPSITAPGKRLTLRPPATGGQAGPDRWPSPRGWGFFLIEKSAEELRTADNTPQPAVEVFVYREAPH